MLGFIFRFTNLHEEACMSMRPKNHPFNQRLRALAA